MVWVQLCKKAYIGWMAVAVLRRLHVYKLIGLLIGSAMFGATFNPVTRVGLPYNFWNTERSSLNINSFALNNCFSYRNFRLPMSALATVYVRQMYCKNWFFDWVFMLGPTILLMRTLEVWSLSVHCLTSIWTTCWWNLNKIVWSKVYKILSFLTKNGSPFLTKRLCHFGKHFCNGYNCLMLNY